MPRHRRRFLAITLGSAVTLAACGDPDARPATERALDETTATTATTATTVAPSSPLAPEGFRAVGIPAGFRWVGEPTFEGVMRVPGGGYWMASDEMIEEQPGAPGLSLAFELLPGSVTLTDADIEAIVRSHGGSGDRVPIEIDDARGWMEAQPGFTNIVLVRSDDVLVLAGGQVTSTELMTILGDLEPIDLPAGMPDLGLDEAPVDVPPSDDLSFDI